jgi:hypothetical protein
MNLSIYLLTEAIVAILEACNNAVEAAHAASADVNEVYTDQQRTNLHQDAVEGEDVWGHMPAMVDAGLDVDIDVPLDIVNAFGLDIATGDVCGDVPELVDLRQWHSEGGRRSKRRSRKEEEAEDVQEMDALPIEAATNYPPSTPTRVPRQPARPHVYGEVSRASRECASSKDPSSWASSHMPEADVAAQASGAACSKPSQTSPSLPLPMQSAVGRDERAREREERKQAIIEGTQATNCISTGGEGEGGKGEGNAEIWEVLSEKDEIVLDTMISVKSESEGGMGLTLCSSWSELAYNMSSAKAESERDIGLNSLPPSLSSTPVRGSTAASTMGKGGKVEADEGGEREGDVWHIRVNRSTGKCYYYNVSCNASSWVLPAKEAIIKVLANTKNELERRLMLQPYIESDSPALLRQNALQTLFLHELHQQEAVLDVFDGPESEELRELEYLLDVVSSQWSLIVSFEEQGNTRHLLTKVLYVSSEFYKANILGH